MLTGIHLLTTYACNFECEHCFVWSRPGAGGTMTIDQVRRVLDQAVELGTVQRVCFEGGEPLLYFPVVLAGLEAGRERGFDVGVVTNAYWATSERDAALWLGPLAAQGVRSISVSDDELHYGASGGERAARVQRAADKLGMEVRVLATGRPACGVGPSGEATVTGGVMFRGRAAVKLIGGLPRRPWEAMTRCPHETLADPGRVHVDAYGVVHLCQGLSMGNVWERPLADLVRQYDPQAHPVVGPLVRGGPAELARTYGVAVADGYVDECHLCYEVRRILMDRFPDCLAPRQMYGLEPAPP